VPSLLLATCITICSTCMTRLSHPPRNIATGAVSLVLALLSCSQASKKVVLNASSLVGPYRYSHLDLEAWIAAGYSADLTADYLGVVGEKLRGHNLAFSLRIPHSVDVRYVPVLSCSTYCQRCKCWPLTA
jgi:hypothetical protein